MRTQAEIIRRATEAQKRDIFGFEWAEYLRALTRESAETLRGSLIKKDADLSDWKPDLLTDEAVRACCVDYMEFAWDKANNCRGISAGRSLAHYRAWLWLMGEDRFENVDDYEFYGKNELRRICEFLGLDAAKWDDGVRVNSESEL